MVSHRNNAIPLAPCSPKSTGIGLALIKLLTQQHAHEYEADPRLDPPYSLLATVPLAAHQVCYVLGRDFSRVEAPARVSDLASDRRGPQTPPGLTPFFTRRHSRRPRYGWCICTVTSLILRHCTTSQHPESDHWEPGPIITVCLRSCKLNCPRSQRYPFVTPQPESETQTLCCVQPVDEFVNTIGTFWRAKATETPLEVMPGPPIEQHCDR